MAREAKFWPREKIQKAEDLQSEITMEDPEELDVVSMPEEPEEAKLYRLQRSQDQISLILMILYHQNYVSDDEKLRQIRVVVE